MAYIDMIELCLRFAKWPRMASAQRKRLARTPLQLITANPPNPPKSQFRQAVVHGLDVVAATGHVAVVVLGQDHFLEAVAGALGREVHFADGGGLVAQFYLTLPLYPFFAVAYLTLQRSSWFSPPVPRASAQTMRYTSKSEE